MSILVAGPTGSGKSTFIHSSRAAIFLPTASIPTNVVYGYEVMEKKIPGDAFVHYNLLHSALTQQQSSEVLPSQPLDFQGEPILQKILSSQRISLAIILVTPTKELLQRARNRQYVEDRVEHKTLYNRELWQKIIENTNLAAAYEHFFSLLEKHRIPYSVVFSSALLPDFFSLTDRVFVPANLRGELTEPPTMATIETVLAQPGCHYQSVLLPHGIVTHKGEYPHIRHGRHESFKEILNEKLWNQSVLDVGCALGDLLHRAERLGAGRLVGIELHPDRFETATSIARLLHSLADIRQCDFMDFEEDETFDHVFALNVIHHVRYFHAFLEKAGRLAKKSLIIEFPTLNDEKFAGANGYKLPGFLLNRLPLIGVSSNRVDQTYVFSPKAIERICLEGIGGFNRVNRFKSPLKHREIMVFER